MRLGHKIIFIIRCDYITKLKSFFVRSRFFGGHSEEETPVPIPNTEVKLFSADGTARETEWESRTPPKILYIPGAFKRLRVFFGFLFVGIKNIFVLNQIYEKNLRNT